MKNIIIDSEQLEEIIRQAYVIGAKECMVFGDNMSPDIRKSRVERIASDMEIQIFNDLLEPFDYENSQKTVKSGRFKVVNKNTPYVKGEVDSNVDPELKFIPVTE